MEEIQLTREQVSRLANDDSAYVMIDVDDRRVDSVANTFGYDEATGEHSPVWSRNENWKELLDGERDSIYWNRYDISVSMIDEVGRARAEGFAAGLFVATALITEDHTDEWAEFFENGGVQG